MCNTKISNVAHGTFWRLLSGGEMYLFNIGIIKKSCSHREANSFTDSERLWKSTLLCQSLLSDFKSKNQ